jgi:hypothetical protein
MLQGFFSRIGRIPDGPARTRAILGSIVVTAGLSAVYTYWTAQRFGGGKKIVWYQYTSRFGAIDIRVTIFLWYLDMFTMTPEWIEHNKRYRKFQNMDPPELTGMIFMNRSSLKH